MKILLFFSFWYQFFCPPPQVLPTLVFVSTQIFSASGNNAPVVRQEAPEILTKMWGMTPRPPEAPRKTKTTRIRDKNDKNDGLSFSVLDADG